MDATVYQSTDGRLQPLCALYEPRLLAQLAPRLAAGRRALTPLLAASNIHRIVSDPQLFVSINQPADLCPKTRAPDSMFES